MIRNASYRPNKLRRARAAHSELASVNALSKLERAGIWAQIFLAGVAIFGYFYTVRPVYQKEQLAEQVAEYDAIIKKQTPKIREIEVQLGALNKERADLNERLLKERTQLTAEMARERTRLTTELKQIERQLSEAKTERQKLESQQEFMTFRYRTPDGTPARTREQVVEAQRHDVRRSTIISMSTSCSFYSGPFARYSIAPRDTKSDSWPFTDAELKMWKEKGSQIPSARVAACINAGAAEMLKRPGIAAYSAEVEAARAEAQIHADKASELKRWAPPHEPDAIIQEFQTRRPGIQQEEVEELKLIEEKYKGWDRSFGDRRVLLQHNYETEKRNARVHTMNREYQAQEAATKKADELRKSINEESLRLLLPSVR